MPSAAQHPAGLGAGVVELAGLADDDRPGADDQDDWMSVRFGIRRSLGWSSAVGGHQVDEPVEQVRRVVRAGGGLGVVLHREGRAARPSRRAARAPRPRRR